MAETQPSVSSKADGHEMWCSNNRVTCKISECLLDKFVFDFIFYMQVQFFHVFSSCKSSIVGFLHVCEDSLSVLHTKGTLQIVPLYRASLSETCSETFQVDPIPHN